MPPAPRGYPIISEIQRTVWSSISVATGERTQAPTLGLTAEARKSESIPIGEGEEVMKPKNLG